MCIEERAEYLSRSGKTLYCTNFVILIGKFSKLNLILVQMFKIFSFGMCYCCINHFTSCITIPDFLKKLNGLKMFSGCN